MDSVLEHNQTLQKSGFFSASDLEENRQGRYSSSQLKQFEAERDFVQQSVGKYDNKQWLIRLIFGFGLAFFAVVLYFVGLFDFLKDVLGGLFWPILLGAFAAALFMVLVVIPRQYQSSVDAFRAMGTPLEAGPLGAIQTIEARAEVYRSQAGINRRGHQSSHISHILQMDGIKFRITDSLLSVIQPKRKYRVYAVNDQGAWVLLSMEVLE
jgi:hypothetical protein